MTGATLFDTSGQTGPDHDGVLGIIGERQLVAVQLFYVARHTSNPIAITPSSFVAVTGRGPRDSNESGKTSFNAAVSLLLGDPEWRMTGGGVATVAQLLFEPDTAGVTATHLSAPQEGFIVGVFADPDDVARSAHTVWLRISSNPKYLRVRHQPGVHLVEGETDADRHRQAIVVWKSLPTTEFGAGSYVEKLYGRSPRCLAYVASRGKQRSGPSLLKMDTGAFTPENIGSALIRLTGRAEALELEKEQRRKLADKVAEVEDKKRVGDTAWDEEEKTLEAVRTRATIRTKLADGNHLWRKHLARGLLDTLAHTGWLTAVLQGIEAEQKHERERLSGLKETEKRLSDFGTLRTEANAAEQALQTADEKYQEAQLAESRLIAEVDVFVTRMRALESQGVRDVRMTIAEAESQLTLRREARADAMSEAAQADDKVNALAEDLDRAERGASGAAAHALSVLAEHGLEATGLMDAVEIADDHRDEWEPRLHPWRAAVCVTEGQSRDALDLLSEVPGAIVVTGPAVASGPLPSGVLNAPGPALTFLRELATRMQPVESGQVRGAFDLALGVTVVAGFPHPTAGRRHIIASLRERLVVAQKTQTQRRDAADSAKGRERDAEHDLATARAAAEHRDLVAKIHAIETDQLPPARWLLAERLAIRSTNLDAHTRAQTNLSNAENTLAQATTARKECNGRLADLDIDQKKTQRSLDSTGLQYWRTEFGGDDTSARALLNWSDGPLDYDNSESVCRPPGPRDPATAVERRKQNTLSQKANEFLIEVLMLLKVDRETGAGAPVPTIAEALRRNEMLTRSGTSGRNTGYAGVASALRDWLTQFEERDQHAIEQITAARALRQREMNYAITTLEGLQATVTNVQDNLERRIEANLDAISVALDHLNRSAPDGYGAKLDHKVQRPVGPDDRWIWSVVPMWRRSPGGRLLPYDNATNSAQEKLFSIHLVLAALLASPHPRGRVLILDELGDSLGEEHRRDVLSAVARVA